jgi:hypothetical protein
MLEYCEHRFEFHKKEWAHVSAEAKDLIAGLLVKVRLCDVIVRTLVNLLRHRLNRKLDLQSLFGLLCTAVLIG